MNPTIDKNGVRGFQASICVPVHKSWFLGVTPKSSTKLPRPPEENRSGKIKRKELQRTMHAI